MRPLFVDSGAWLAVYHQADQYHRSAIALWNSLKTQPGIAERFIRTLKEWLEDKSWQDDEELATRLQPFLDEYNDRPHQGLAIPGLSPNEFAKRIWLM